MSIETTLEESTVILKTRELCQAILDEPGIRSAMQRIDSFMEDNKARRQYEDLVTKGQNLQEKQQNAIALTGEEIADFEQERDALMGNPVARGFIDAQEELQKVQRSIQKYVSKTIELGHIPSEDEMCGGGSCGGGGCGCGH